MKLADFLRLFPEVKMTNSQLAFCVYLERRGQRFLVDFGFENAIAKGLELIAGDDALPMEVHFQ